MPRLIKDITGQRFGRLSVLAYSHRGNHRSVFWLCKCDCGKETTVRGSYLAAGETRSCGCLYRESAARINFLHGATAGRKLTPEFICWCGIRQRIYDTNCKRYPDYGGRGITMCKEWTDSFQVFLNDVGLKPSPALTLDRINNEKGYEPGNCAWRTRREQGNNKRNNRMLTFNGETLSIAQWARKLGFSRNLLAGRFWRGWNAERILTTPA